MTNKQCPICGEQTLNEMRGTFRFTPPPNIPGGVLEISETTWEHCSSCGENILSLELEAAIDKEQYRRQGLLLPDEIRDVREKTGLSAVDMGLLLGVGEKTFTRWENGRSIQTKASDTLIRLIDKNAEMFALLDAERAPDRPLLIGRYFSCLEQLKGANSVAMAAHGGSLTSAAMQDVRRTLQAVRDQKGLGS